MLNFKMGSRGGRGGRGGRQAPAAAGADASTKQALADSAVLESVRTIKWPARKRSSSGYMGGHLSKVLGFSTEFTEYRAYRQGDDPKRIDWKLLARTERAYVKLSQERMVVPTMIVVDASGSLAYPAESLEKWQMARHMAMALASGSYATGDPVGVVVASEGEGSHGGMLRLPPRTRRGVVYDITRILSSVKPAGSPEIAPLLGTAIGSAQRIAIVSDFLGDSEHMLKVVAQLTAAGREVFGIHIIHETELNPPKDQALYIDPEQADFKRPMTDRTWREYVDNFTTWCDKLARDWRMAGAYYSRAVTGDSIPKLMRSIVVPPGGPR